MGAPGAQLRGDDEIWVREVPIFFVAAVSFASYLAIRWELRGQIAILEQKWVFWGVQTRVLGPVPNLREGTTVYKWVLRAHGCAGIVIWMPEVPIFFVAALSLA